MTTLTPTDFCGAYRVLGALMAQRRAEATEAEAREVTACFTVMRITDAAYVAAGFGRPVAEIVATQPGPDLFAAMEACMAGERAA